MHKKHILLPQPTHNSGTMNVPHHVDSTTDSSESSNNDQMLFDIMESHDDSHNKVLCLFSMFVMNCFDEDEVQYECKWSGSPPCRRKKIECDFQGSFKKLEKQYFNREASTYTEEQFERRFHVPRIVFADVWRERVLSSSITIALRMSQEFILLFEWLPVGDD